MSNKEIQEKLNRALEYHQAGRFPEAEIIYTGIIQEDPNNSSALNLLGILSYQLGKFEEAITFIKRAIEINPSAYFYKNLGNVYRDKNEINKAVACYLKAIESEPDDPAVYFNLGMIFRRLNNLDKAAEYYKKALELKPSMKEAYFNLGNIFVDKGELEEAIGYYQKLMLLDPKDAYLYNNLANAYADLNRPDEAIACYKKAFEIKPDFIDACINLANALYKFNRKTEAINYYRIIIEQKPDYVDAYVNLGNIYNDIDSVDEAFECYQKAFELSPDNPGILLNISNVFLAKNQLEIAVNYCKNALSIKPDYIDAYLNLGRIYNELNKYEEAIESLNKALQIKPDYTEAYLNLGLALKNQKKINESVSSYKKAIELRPDYAEAYFNLGIVYLLNGNYEDGWKNYEWRFHKKSKVKRIHIDSKPKWDGKSLDKKTIYVYHEQGLGDTIQFSRFLPVLNSLGAKVLFKPQSGLEQLFRQNDLKAEIIENTVNNDDIEFDTHISLMSLPYVLNINEDNIPFKEGYLQSDKQKAGFFKDKFFNNEDFKIGIKWQGNPDGNKNRAIPLSCFYKLAQLTGVRLYSLQKGSGVEQINNIPADLKIVNLEKELRDFSDTAAIIDNLDLIICNDSSIAHLAGAMGKPTWVLLPFVPEWRWLLERDDSPWYESIRLFRQKSVADWNSVMEEVYQAIQIKPDIIS